MKEFIEVWNSVWQTITSWIETSDDFKVGLKSMYAFIIMWSLQILKQYFFDQKLTFSGYLPNKLALQTVLHFSS